MSEGREEEANEDHELHAQQEHISGQRSEEQFVNDDEQVINERQQSGQSQQEVQGQVERQQEVQGFIGRQEEQAVEQEEQAVEQEEVGEIDKNIQGISIFCPLCKDYIVHSVTTTCEHTFCELCLTEYMLYLDQCPSCYQRIRNQKISCNILLDNLISDYIRKYEPEDMAEYQEKMDQYKIYKKNRTVTDLETGAEVDIRDLDFVWCSGKVHRTVNKFQERRVKFLIIKYDKSSKKEEISENSVRIAPKGFFTHREDIPKYEKGKLILKNIEDNISYLIPKDDDEEVEEVLQNQEE